MIEYELEFTQDALDDIQRHKKSGNKPLLKKLEKLLGELKQHPTTGTGQIELLKHYKYLQPIITQYFIDNKSEIWLLFLIAHSKR